MSITVSRSFRITTIFLLLLWAFLWSLPRQRDTISSSVINTYKSSVSLLNTIDDDESKDLQLHLPPSPAEPYPDEIQELPEVREIQKSVEQVPIPVPVPVPAPAPAFSGELSDVMNATLGFQKIYVLSMPSRTDKRDALILSAHLTGIDLEFIDGVKPEEVSEKAVPLRWSKGTGGTLGCWRGHMNVYQKILKDRVQTAMIMEDDVDWEAMIKAQLTDFARGTRSLINSSLASWAPERPQAPSPYGNGWDLLFIGHCGLNNLAGKDREYWITENDPTVVTPEERKIQRQTRWARRPDWMLDNLAGNTTRVVTPVKSAVCLASYAISLQGAMKILYDQSILPNAIEIDNSLGKFCERGDGLCLAPWPSIFGTHVPAGDMSKDSDRQTSRPGRVREIPQSYDLTYPTRINLPTLIKGSTIVKAQYPEKVALKEIDLATYKHPEGKLFANKDDEKGKDKEKEKEKGKEKEKYTEKEKEKEHEKENKNVKEEEKGREEKGPEEPNKSSSSVDPKAAADLVEPKID
ncbi:hypothetical protein BP5796_06963 [Coleophoma crateriformis]|uniref:Glycosyl transferase family 25 domain-containing protein n=1 Tax=Coleophoma crateriformis TaxID=565419 RepID=A0A3D8RPX9_9HELO|nr:hypothetical protein BP5796_06963 [Coleophoma crateriformis]